MVNVIRVLAGVGIAGAAVLAVNAFGYVFGF